MKLEKKSPGLENPIVIEVRRWFWKMPKIFQRLSRSSDWYDIETGKESGLGVDEALDNFVRTELLEAKRVKL